MRLLKLGIELLAPPAFFRLLQLASGALFSHLLAQSEHYEVLSDLPTPAVPLHPLSELLDPLPPGPPPPLSRLGVCLRPGVLLGEGRGYIVGIEDSLIIGVVQLVDVRLAVTVSSGRGAKRGGGLGQVVGVDKWLVEMPDTTTFVRWKKAAVERRGAGERPWCITLRDELGNIEIRNVEVKLRLIETRRRCLRGGAEVELPHITHAMLFGAAFLHPNNGIRRCCSILNLIWYGTHGAHVPRQPLFVGDTLFPLVDPSRTRTKKHQFDIFLNPFMVARSALVFLPLPVEVTNRHPRLRLLKPCLVSDSACSDFSCSQHSYVLSRPHSLIKILLFLLEIFISHYPSAHFISIMTLCI